MASRGAPGPTRGKTASTGPAGDQQLVLVPFNQELAQLSASRFVEEMLIGTLQAPHRRGANFRFGRGREGGAETLKAMAGDGVRDRGADPGRSRRPHEQRGQFARPGRG